MKKNRAFKANMILSVCLDLILLCISGYGQSENFIWAKQAGGTAGANNSDYYDIGWGITTDIYRNVIVTGRFMESITFGDLRLVDPNPNYWDTFISKYNSLGELDWARIAYSDVGSIGQDIATDELGNIYITGNFGGTINFGNIALTCAGNSDFYLAKYDPSGEVEWAKSFGGPDLEEGRAICLDAAGNIFVTGFSRCFFLSKFDGSGNMIWTRTAGNWNTMGNDLAIDASGNIIVIGTFQKTMTIGTTSLTAAGLNDIFVAKYNQVGNALWAKQVGGLSSFDSGNAVAVDHEGNVVITGMFSGPASFGSVELQGIGGNDIFIAKYDPSGNAIWAKQAGGTLDYGVSEEGKGIAVDALNNVVVVGYINSTAFFDQIELPGPIAWYDYCPFFAKYDVAGNIIWVLSGDGDGFDMAYDIAVDNTDKFVSTGCFKSSRTFGGTMLNSLGGSDVFITKIGEILQQHAPIAICQDVVVSAETILGSFLSAEQVNNGSYDPDGDPITMQLLPSGPYPIGQTEVKLVVTDNKGAFDQCTSIVTVVNHSPQLTEILGPVDPISINNSVNLSAGFLDNDLLQSHTAIWNWGDGSSPTVFEITDGSRTACATHAYSTAGVYTVSLTITDNCGASDGLFFQYLVTFNPNGGFVTGGGWINSPPGALVADPSLTGKATFGFISKYQKGASIPTGQTEFQFRVADLSFCSTEYQWLVISGAKAKYKGFGQINDKGEYGFMISAIDGQLNQSIDSDKFRLKIWEKYSGSIVYDNQLGDEDDADATCTIGGGSIVIHKSENLKKASAELTQAEVPLVFYLSQNFPNPFNPITNIDYQVVSESFVSLLVFNLRGEIIRTLVNSTVQAGAHKVQWDAKDEQGLIAPAGIYLCQLKAGAYSRTIRMLLLK